MLVKLSHTKALCVAFLRLQFGYVILWQKAFGAKAALKTLVKLTPGVCTGYPGIAPEIPPVLASGIII
jgi:hypothetical protein